MIQTQRLDEYIEKAAPFAQPILRRFREMVGMVCPEAEETFKWSFPVFIYNGSNLCDMAAFKHHCSFGFWLASLMDDPAGIMKKGDEREGMGSFGKITDISQVPDLEVLRPYFVQAMVLIEQGAKLPRSVSEKKPEIPMPDDFQQALMATPQADLHFEKLTPGRKREYLDWITSAKTENTRNSRIQKSIEWLKEGKSLLWRYEKK